jgi:PIN domain nuclease of toxin-antitoxin system
MLICQAIEHNMTIATMDAAIAQYPINILPKL